MKKKYINKKSSSAGFIFICCAIAIPIVMFVGIIAASTIGSGGGTDSSGGGASTSALCSAKPKMSPVSMCPASSGVFCTRPPANGYFYTSTFGCSASYRDTEDACDGGGCGGAHLKSIETTTGTVKLKGLSGPRYQEAIKYFSANRHMFGCDKRLKVTSVKTGKAVVIITLEAGPNKDAAASNGGHALIDMSGDALKAIDISSGGVVKVEEVPDDTPIGPIVCATTP